jgi:uroporphyrinogen decarboxylase
MEHPSKLFISALRKKPGVRPPFWFMRQAGRYLPEYKQLRSTAKNFLDFCYSPEKASEATLQPIRRFGMDAAIIFSDILVIPDALGMDVRFEEGRGPLLEPISERKQLDALDRDMRGNKREAVYEALRLTKKALPESTALIGFCGSPWTLACYMIEGKGSRDFQSVRSKIYQDPEFFTALIDLLVHAVSTHAIAQINAGAEVIQLFDSWSGVLSEKQFSDWSIEPTARIVSNIRAAHPDVPVIGFPRMAGSKVLEYVKRTGVDAVSFDGSVSLNWARDNLLPQCVVQGNLDPVVLVGNKQAMLEEARTLLSVFADKAFVFNLGHGILPTTPIEHVEALCRLIMHPSS